MPRSRTSLDLTDAVISGFGGTKDSSEIVDAAATFAARANRAIGPHERLEFRACSSLVAKEIVERFRHAAMRLVGAAIAPTLRGSVLGEWRAFAAVLKQPHGVGLAGLAFDFHTG